MPLQTSIIAMGRFTYIVALILSLTACAPRQYQVYNETGEDVLVRLFHRDDEQRGTVDYTYIKDGDWKDICYPSAPCGFDVIFLDRTWRYEHVTHHLRNFPVESVKIRIEPEGQMYRYYSSRSLPELRSQTDRMQRHVEQPEGYPCLPEILPQGLVDRYR